MNKVLAFLKSPGPGHLPKWAWGAIVVGGIGAGLLILHISQSSAATGGSSTDTVSPSNPGDTGAGDAGGTGTGSPLTPNGDGGGGGGGGGTDGGVSGYYDGGGSYDTSGATGGSAGFGLQPLAGLPPPVGYSGPPQLQGTQIVTYQPTPAGQAIAQAPYQQPSTATVTYNTVQRVSPQNYNTVTYTAPSPPSPASSGTTSKGFAV